MLENRTANMTRHVPTSGESFITSGKDIDSSTTSRTGGSLLLDTTQFTKSENPMRINPA
jgi:hypothetical protein